MKTTFVKQQGQQPVNGLTMSIWHRCASRFGIVGGIF